MHTQISFRSGVWQQCSSELHAGCYTIHAAYGDGHTFKRKRSSNITFWDLFSRVVTQPNILRCVIQKPINYQLHISECNQSRCGAWLYLGWLFFAVRAHFVYVSWKSVCTFTVFRCYRHQEWCIVWGPVNLTLVVIRWDVLFFSCSQWVHTVKTSSVYH